MLVGTVRDLWRYPVKSMRGERSERLEIDQRGVIGDRLYAVRDAEGKFGSGKNWLHFRRMDGLLRFRAVYDNGVPVLTFPDGTSMRGDDPAIHDALSAQLKMPVTLSREAELTYFDTSPLHLLTTASLRTLGEALDAQAVDVRRCRPNIFIETEAGGFPEDSWKGHELAVGADVRVRVLGRTVRCVMIGLPQDELPDDPRILKAAGRVNEVCIGVYADVLVPGAVHVGDSIRLL